VILNWNNKPSLDSVASDDNWGYGSVHRVDLLTDAVGVRFDGKIDDPGAAILDAAWPRLTDAVMRPALGPLVDRLARLLPRDDPANPRGSAYYGGWYGYVEKDLRRVLGRRVVGPYRTHFCGAGDLAVCRTSLWAALEEAGAELAAAQGPDPAAWRADATGDRIRFAGFLPETMRWSNRPTFQQVMSFRSHRPRR
jgi:hypothetical protein